MAIDILYTYYKCGHKVAKSVLYMSIGFIDRPSSYKLKSTAHHRLYCSPRPYSVISAHDCTPEVVLG